MITLKYRISPISFFFYFFPKLLVPLFPVSPPYIPAPTSKPLISTKPLRLPKVISQHSLDIYLSLR